MKTFVLIFVYSDIKLTFFYGWVDEQGHIQRDHNFRELSRAKTSKLTYLLS